METYQSYNGFGIRYFQITGTTKIEEFGYVIKEFIGVGEMKGCKLAKEYIDKELN